MRTLDSNLLAEQKKNSIEPAVKIVLSYGETTYTIEEDMIKDIKGFESLWSAYAKEVVLDNSKGYFTEKDLKGFQAVIYRGLKTPAGEKYSYGSPMKVVWQEFDDSPGNKTCQLTMLGIPDLMDLDEANDDYIPDSDDETTVKSLLTAIAGATLACFNHCQAYEIVWDNDENDDALLLFKPRDSFRVYQKGSRLAAFRRILEYCACGARFENDGKIHILIPTTSGESYDYEYSLESGHPFLSKAYRQTLVIPNKIVVESQKDDDPQYSGYATHAASYALLPKPNYFRTRLESNAQATSIAQALQDRATFESEMGAANSLMNCGAEIYDYVKVGAFDDEDVYRVGNIGWLEWHFNPEKSTYHFRFGFGAPPLSRHTKELYRSLEAESGAAFDRLYAKDAYIENLQIEKIDAVWLDPEGNIDLSQIGDTLDSLPDGEYYARQRWMHLDAETGLTLDEYRIYYIRFSPDSDEIPIRRQDTAPTPEYEGEYWIDTSGENPIIKRWTGSEWITIDQDEIDLLNRGILMLHTKKANLSVDGLVLLDNVQEGTEFGLLNKADLTSHHLKLSAAIEDSNHRLTSDSEKAAWDAKPEDMDEIDMGVTWGKPLKDQITAQGYLNLNANTYKDGEWYNESGVEIDASHGINIYGVNNALTTRATKTGAIQCSVNADGQIVAGGGDVVIDANGISFNSGETLKLSRSSYWGYISINPSYQLQIQGPSAGVAIVGKLIAQGGIDIEDEELDAYYATKFQIPIYTALGNLERNFGQKVAGDDAIMIYSSGAWRENG